MLKICQIEDLIIKVKYTTVGKNKRK